ncbi:MAG: T9SS type A sorting domain-containing protein [Flavobacteriales bacterium]|nr:T9SS type A sorting domain-containing protein [Flavobacteriales bacterium]MBL6873396.1 T9SS type A sorting domain-containing protein [Flavobacteriales bacterium]
MKNILLLTISLVFGFSALAQQNPCEPQANLQDSTYGLWPDTTQNLPLAVKEVYYEEHIQIKTPNTVGEVMGDPFYVDDVPFVNLAPLNIDIIKLISIEGLPESMSAYLSNQDSIFEGNTVACVTLYGTPTADEVGQHDIVLNIDGWISIPLFGTLSLFESLGDYEKIDGYKLIVQSSASLEEGENTTFTLSQNAPNPFSNTTTIELYSKDYSNYEFLVVDLMGKVVHKETINAVVGLNTIEVVASSYEAGMYFYSIRNGQDVLTKKMIIQDF